jgi:hypothetical protein
LWLSSTWIKRISVFCSSRWVAKLWRSVCIDTRLAMCAVRGQVDRAVELPGRHRVHRVEPWEQPVVGQELALGAADSLPCAQPLEQHEREQGEAVLAALPCSTRSVMRSLSMSVTFNAQTSAARSPAL